MKYDYLIVGSGLSGAVFAQQCSEHGKTCMIIEKRNHIAGNCYDKKIEGINVHENGPHIFFTNSLKLWEYANRFSHFIPYFHKVKVKTNNKLYSMPVNMQTIYEVYGIQKPEEAKKKIEEVKIKNDNPKNLEEWCLSQVGKEIYELFIKGYTIKQWGKCPLELPASIIKRLPIRFDYNDNWHDCLYSGIPEDGYTKWIQNILGDTKIEIGVDFFSLDWMKYAKNLIYTGRVDEFFDYTYGELEYRTLKFEQKILNGDYQGVAQVNYTDENVPFTRTTEHKHFLKTKNEKTVVTWEYPGKWEKDSIPYYSINDLRNNEIYSKYKKLIDSKTIMIGRLANYQYFNMDQTIANALSNAQRHLKNK